MAEELLQNNNQTDSQEQLEPQTSSNKRIAKNALMLYIRMFLTMIVGLYTSRVVLATLGVEDYGIYGVVGGVVAMMGFLNASMSGATSRFLTFELGRGDQKRLSETFSSALIVHIGIALIVFILAETVGLWFLCNKLIIPAGRMNAAHWVYQCSILSAMLGITQAPYNASIIAHEKMDIYAYVEILNVSLKLLIVYLLVIGNFDKLKLYAVLVLAVSVLIMLIYRIYCIRKFKETHFHWIWKKEILKPLLSFSGWDLYGNMAWSVRQQGANFILNAFYGPVINAASGIASTIQGILNSFSANVITAFKPPIIKNYAVNSYENMNSLLQSGSKFSSLLLMIFTIPLIVKTEYVLTLWLRIAPSGSIFMTQISLIMNIISCFNSIIIIGIHASGKVVLTGLINGTIYLFSLPAMYILLKLGYSYKACYVLFLIISILFCLINLIILKYQVSEFNLRHFIIRSFVPMTLTGIISFYIVKYISINLFYNDSILSLIAIFIISFIIILSVSFIIALSKVERKQIFHKVCQVLNVR